MFHKGKIRRKVLFCAADTTLRITAVNKKILKKKVTSQRSLPLVVLVGFEPTQTEPESGVLPLHHKAISFVFLHDSLIVLFQRVQSYGLFLVCANTFKVFLLFLTKIALFSL